MYGQLAEKEKDRKQRSVIRAKEREVRSSLELQRIQALSGRIDGFLAQRKHQAARRILDDVQHQITGKEAQELLQQSYQKVDRSASQSRQRVIF